ncbi:MAG: hypothetical protein ABWK05_03425 [Pyrobaculum sp.]
MLKSASGIAAGLFFLLSVVFPPYLPHLLLSRATAGYMLAATSVAYLFTKRGRHLFASAVTAAAVYILSFVDVEANLLLAPVALLLYIWWGWIYLLYSAWRLGGWLGLLVFLALQLALLYMPMPGLEFANLLPSGWLRSWGDKPESTYFNWARYFLYCITTYFTLLATKLATDKTANRLSQLDN